MPTSAARISRGPTSAARISRRPTSCNAHLEGANLVGAHLEGANLFDAHLEGATSSERISKRANLIGAHLEGANPQRARISRGPSSRRASRGGRPQGGERVYRRPSSATPMATPRRNFPKGWPGRRIGPIRRLKCGLTGLFGKPVTQLDAITAGSATAMAQRQDCQADGARSAAARSLLHSDMADRHTRCRHLVRDGT